MCDTAIQMILILHDSGVLCQLHILDRKLDHFSCPVLLLFTVFTHKISCNASFLCKQIAMIRYGFFAVNRPESIVLMWVMFWHRRSALLWTSHLQNTPPPFAMNFPFSITLNFTNAPLCHICINLQNNNQNLTKSVNRFTKPAEHQHYRPWLTWQQLGWTPLK